MKLSGKDIGKKFGKNWIFKHLDFEIETGNPTAITGKNGAGKSTLIQIIAGFLTPSQGQILINSEIIDESKAKINLIGPYTEIIEEFNLNEFLYFHSQFKNPLCSFEEMAVSASLPLNKPISDFSTGMKQRVRLITSFFFENDILFMDEPTSNLDNDGTVWFANEFSKVITNHLLIIASNNKEEITLCDEVILLK